ncbi:MAG TPA: hypothetical protein VJL58_04050, partial [Pyrinomonadaceae bacterium]|nr:hypothetical protein [Pyrinomonadaceae bacterium]
IETLKTFYRKVQPAGFWKPAKLAVLEDDPGFKKQLSFKVELFNTLIAMIGITALYVSMLYLVLHRLEIGFALLATTIVSAIILYFTWYKTLPPPSEPPSEEIQNIEEQLDETEPAMEAA